MIFCLSDEVVIFVVATVRCNRKFGVLSLSGVDVSTFDVPLPRRFYIRRVHVRPSACKQCYTVGDIAKCLLEY